MAGILPFGAMFIELFFIFSVSPAAVSWLSSGAPVFDLGVDDDLQAIWENQFYYLFGFLFLVFIILVVSCSQISIVMVYFQLCAEVPPPTLCGERWRGLPLPSNAVTVALCFLTSGLQMVVENIPGVWRLRLLRPHLRRLLLCEQGKGRLLLASLPAPAGEVLGWG